MGSAHIFEEERDVHVSALRIDPINHYYRGGAIAPKRHIRIEKLSVSYLHLAKVKRG